MSDSKYGPFDETGGRTGTVELDITFPVGTFAIPSRPEATMSSSQFDDLPKLPEGWHYEAGHLKDLVRAVWPEHGVMSLDMKERRVGIGGGGMSLSANSPKYEGRGWKQRMVADAVAELQKVWG